MKIGLNTYSFRKELGSQSMTLQQVWKFAKNIGLIEGIELLDRHIPGWPNGDLKGGIKQIQEETASFGLQIYALGPHLKMYQGNSDKMAKEILEFRRWIDLAADHGIPQIRSQVGGSLNFWTRIMLNKAIGRVNQLLDQVLPYAQQRKVKIGIETHWAYSSYPPFLKAVTDHYKDTGALGIIFDWGNFYKNDARYEALTIAVQKHNHVHNHVKIFHFGDNWQETEYDSMRIVREHAQNGFQGFFSMEFEGKQPTLEGVFKSAHALKYAITNGQHKIPLNFDWNTLIQ